MNEKTIARFWAKVNKDGPVPDHAPHLGSCWIWTACKLRAGYGLFGFGPKLRTTHRISFFLEHGRWPECALHRCDNPSCVRPDHLFEGSKADNVRDMYAKKRDRAPFGAAHGNTVLTAEQARQVRAMASSGVVQRIIAQQFGINQSQVSRILHGKRRVRLDQESA